MNPHGLFGDEDLKLLEFAQKGLLELSNEARAALTAEVQDGHDDDEIEVQPSVALPYATQGELPLLGGQAAEPGQQARVHGMEEFVSKRPARIVPQRQVDVVAAGRSSAASTLKFRVAALARVRGTRVLANAATRKFS